MTTWALGLLLFNIFITIFAPSPQVQTGTNVLFSFVPSSGSQDAREPGS